MNKFLLILLLGAFFYVTPASAQRADILKVSVSDNEMNKDEKGMFISTDYVVKGLKGTSINYTIFFNDDKGKSVYSDTPNYKSTSNELCCYKDATAGYESTIWTENKLFFPYSLLPKKIGKAKYNMVVNIRYTNMRARVSLCPPVLIKK